MIDHCERCRIASRSSTRSRGADSAQRSATQRDAARQRPRLRGALLPVDRRLRPESPAAAMTVPPSGHLAGLYARVDNDRGVFKAPANEALRGVLDLERAARRRASRARSTSSGINVIRALPGPRHPWSGARARSPTSTQWRYVNVRRLLLVHRGVAPGGRREFVVFEPNDADAVGAGQAAGHGVPDAPVGRRRARRRHAGARPSACASTRSSTRRRARRSGSSIIEVTSVPDHAGRVRRVPDHPAARRAAGRGVTVAATRRERTQPWPTASDVDPYRNFNFLVEIDGITQAGVRRVHRLRLDQRPDRVPRGRRTARRCASCPG